MALPKAFLTWYTDYMLAFKFEGPFGMLGDQVARFSARDVTRVLMRKQNSSDLLSRIHCRDAAKMSMSEYMAIFNISEYRDIDLYGNPSLRLDLCTPLPERYHGIFRTVADIGTLEHIIDPWQALVNIGQMLAVGGKVFLLVPSKEALDHGYYTISPQLLFDFFSTNGFKILRFDLLSFLGNYDSRRCFFFRTDYLKDRWKLHRAGSELPLVTRFERRLRCFIADYARGTISVFVAEKQAEVDKYVNTVQSQHQH